MFKWLKEKATQASINTCKINIRLSTKNLVAISNMDSRICDSGSSANENYTRTVVKVQGELFEDVIVGHSNGLSLYEIENTVIDPELAKIEVSDGARLAIKQVIQTAAETLGVQYAISKK